MAHRQATWFQYRFGKLVSSEDGPIIPGEEHGLIGISAGFPEGLQPLIHPSRLGTGFGESFNWDAYPWSTTRGGFVCRPCVTADGTPYVVAGRIRHRPEAGEERQGRRFTLAHIAVTPAEQWHPLMLPAIFRELSPDPLVQIDRDLPEMETSCDLDESLADDAWERLLAAYVVPVASGEAVSIQDWNADLEAQMRDFAWSLCAFPFSIAWRVGLGVALGNMDGTLGLAQGQTARGRVRVIGGQRRTVDNVSFQGGESYVSWLNTALGTERRSAGRLWRVLEAGMPDFLSCSARPGAGAGDWRADMAEIVSSLQERAEILQLERALREGNGVVDPSRFHRQKGRVLAMALEQPSEVGMCVLRHFLSNEHAAAWKEVARTDPRRRAWAELLGFVDCRDPADLVPCVDVPLDPPLAERARATLDALWSRGADPSAWQPLLTAMAGLDADHWAMAWYRKHEAEILAVVLPPLIEPGEGGRSRLPDWLPVADVASAVAALLAHEDHEDWAPLERLARHLDADGADRLLSAVLIWPGNASWVIPVGRMLKVLKDSGRSARWLRRFSGQVDEEVTHDDLVTLADQLVYFLETAEGSPESRLSAVGFGLELVLLVWNHLDRRPPVGEILAAAIGQPYAAVFLGWTGAADGWPSLRRRAGALLSAPVASTLDPLIIDRLWCALRDRPWARAGGSGRMFLKDAALSDEAELLAEAMKHARQAPSDRTAAVLWQALDGVSDSAVRWDADLDGASVREVELVAATLDRRGRRHDLAQMLAAAPDAERFFVVLPNVRVSEVVLRPSARLLRSLLETVISPSWTGADHRRLREALIGLGWANAEGWRILFSPVHDPGPEEQAILQQLSAESLTRLLCTGWERTDSIPVDWLDKVFGDNGRSLAAVASEPRTLRTLCDILRSAGGRTHHFAVLGMVACEAAVRQEGAAAVERVESLTRASAVKKMLSNLIGGAQDGGFVEVAADCLRLLSEWERHDILDRVLGSAGSQGVGRS